jgi:hypothetical protein
MQNDVRITVVERAELVLRPFYNMELFDAPGLDTDSSSSACPSGLLVPSRFPDVFLKLASSFQDSGEVWCLQKLTSEPSKAILESLIS